jgi:16S rRNA C967 or C1407 C5-methylase (RsmB/RsmF family)/NOL1/NOP2/fmu family ribosome biogenesis protein
VTQLPPGFLQSLQGIPGFDENAFADVHNSGEQVVSIRINPAKFHGSIHEHFPGAVQVPWCRYGYYLPSRPSFTLDPLLHAGAYYVQEASSMFLEQVFNQQLSSAQTVKVLDLCAAPGGKSTLIQSLISADSLLVSNEVIKSRVAVLNENLVKWGGDNVIVTNNDAADFSRLKHFFDVVVVDAPCSGSGLFRRDPHAISEWSDDAVMMCSLRQQRILQEAFECLAPGGLLIYSTCSYSREENENICDWLMDHRQVEPVKVDVPGEWNIVGTESEKHHVPAYRFYPDRLKGEGFFVAAFRSKDGERSEITQLRKKRLTKAGRDQSVVAGKWMKDAGRYEYFENEAGCFVFPGILSADLEVVFQSLYLRKAGILVGRFMKTDLVPDHELAVSGAASDNLQRISLKKEQALQYLRKEEVTLQFIGKGWALMRFEDYDLGWVKLLANRHNNYYPKEWRILKSGTS